MELRLVNANALLAANHTSLCGSIEQTYSASHGESMTVQVDSKITADLRQVIISRLQK